MVARSAARDERGGIRVEKEAGAKRAVGARKKYTSKQDQ